jgi:intraflagellar transport protein 88
VAQASRHAHLAVRHDRYNAKALVNLGNCLLESKGELERAKELYLEAIGVEADCAEAIFNLGLVNRQLGALGEALQAFEKLHTIVPSSPEVIRHIASLHEQLGNPKAAAKYYSYLLTRVPTDAGALAYLGQMAAKDEDEAQAYHFHSEACGIQRPPVPRAGSSESHQCPSSRARTARPCPPLSPPSPLPATGTAACPSTWR